MNKIKKIMMFSFFVSALAMLGGCGTVKGFGQDVILSASFLREGSPNCGRIYCDAHYREPREKKRSR